MHSACATNQPMVPLMDRRSISPSCGFKPCPPAGGLSRCHYNVRHQACLLRTGWSCCRRTSQRHRSVFQANISRTRATAPDQSPAPTSTIAATSNEAATSQLVADANSQAGSNASSSSSTTTTTTSSSSSTTTTTTSSIAAAAPTSEEPNRVALYQAVAIGTFTSVFLGILNHDWVEAHQALAMSIVFCISYLGIITEEVLGLNKAAVALAMAVSLWTIRSTGGDTQIDAEVAEALGNVSELIFFLLGAMTVVEVVDAHDGFRSLAAAARTDSRRHLVILVATLTFLLSAVLDNLTTTIVVLSLLQRLVPDDRELRLLLGAIVVVAANAGGAWTPIGDVTTTMLWTGGQLSAVPTVRDLLLPSLLSVAVPVGIMAATYPELQGPVTRAPPSSSNSDASGGSSSSSSGNESSSSSSSSSSAGDAGLVGAVGVLAAASSTSPPTAAAAAAAADAVLGVSLSAAGSGAVAAFPSAHPSSSSSSSSSDDAHLTEGQAKHQDSAAATSGNSTVIGSTSSTTAAAATSISSTRRQQHGNLVLAVGVGSLVAVPVFKYLTGLPPFMGMLSGLAVLWLLTDALHYGEDRAYPRVQDALRNLDIGGVMFFLGILMAVEALNTAGLLRSLAESLNSAVPNVDIIAAVVGLASAVVDNVPLVAATMGMYDLATVPQDSQLWQLIALCAGTGGSLLVIGSAAGVAFMGIEGAGFGWYARRISPWVLAGYGAAIAAYVAAHGLPGASLP